MVFGHSRWVTPPSSGDDPGCPPVSVYVAVITCMSSAPASVVQQAELPPPAAAVDRRVLRVGDRHAEVRLVAPADEPAVLGEVDPDGRPGVAGVDRHRRRADLP